MKRLSLLAGLLIFAPVIAHADAAAEALFRKCVAAENKVQTLEATAQFTHRERGQTKIGSFMLTLQKPNQARYKYSDPQNSGKILLVFSNGQRFLIYDAQRKCYVELPLDPKGMTVAAVVTPIGGGIETACFFAMQSLTEQQKPKSEMKISGSITIEGMLCRILQIETSHDITYKIYIGPDSLVHGSLMVEKNNQLETRLLHRKINGKLPDALFDWMPPKEAQAVTMQEFFPSTNTKTPNRK